MTSDPTNHAEADALLTGRCKDRRKVANNTWLERHDDGAIAVRLHDTDVVTYHPAGGFTLDSGGWRTVTTKERMSRFTDISVSQTAGEWFISEPNPAFDRSIRWPDTGNEGVPYWLESFPYADGATRLPDGTWRGVPAPDEMDALRSRNRKTKRQITKFVKSITAEQIVTAWEDTAGDCFLCRFPGQPTCLQSHLDEGYFHATLASRAVGNDYVMSMIYGAAKRGQVSDMLTRKLAAYLRKNLLEGVATR